MERSDSFLMNLPPEMIIHILSRLPVRDVQSCRCVCKKAFQILSTPQFADSHLSQSKSKSNPGLVILHSPRSFSDNTFRLYEFDRHDIDAPEELQYCPPPIWISHFTQLIGATDPWNIVMESSVNGLIFLRRIDHTDHSLYICNPITQECITLSGLKEAVYYPTIHTYGFGVSARTGQYKIVRILHGRVMDPDNGEYLSFPNPDCKVYTLGSTDQSWRSIAPPGSSFCYECYYTGALLNGNLHWLVQDLTGSMWISCLDLETESFHHFSYPNRFFGSVVVLDDCLCVCDNSSDDEIVIWVMKEYGVEKSWSKELVMSKFPHQGPDYAAAYPLRVWEKGVLLLIGNFSMKYYSRKDGRMIEDDIFEVEKALSVCATPHVHSFISLKNIGCSCL